MATTPNVSATATNAIQSQIGALAPYSTTAVASIQSQKGALKNPKTTISRRTARIAQPIGICVRKWNAGMASLVYRIRFSIMPAAPMPPPTHMVQTP